MHSNRPQRPGKSGPLADAAASPDPWDGLCWYTPARPQPAQAPPNDPLLRWHAASPYSPEEHMAAARLRQVYRAERRRHEALLSAVRPETLIARRFVDSSLLDPAKARRVAGEWLHLARLVLKRRIDPHAYIRRHFEQLGAGERAPWPGELSSRQALDRYPRLQEQALARLRTDLQQQRQAFAVAAATSVAQSDPRAAGLLSRTAPLSDLFRFCEAQRLAAASDAGSRPLFGRIAAQYRLPAALQYGHDAQLYQLAWGQFVPEGFHELASGIFSQLFQ